MVYIILGKGFEPVEAIAPCDILRRGGVDVKLAGIGGKTVEAAHTTRYLKGDCKNHANGKADPRTGSTGNYKEIWYRCPGQ